MQKLNTVKGTKDLFGDIVNSHQKIYKIFSEISSFFNFQLISTPILENEKIFIKTLGKSSDIISKEMYNFTDQGGDNLVLRPEGTAAVARALISNSLQEHHNKSFFYYGPMFRRERPQSGRLRQFHQIGVEVFGEKNFLDDIKVIILAEKFLEKIGIRKDLCLQINTLGNYESRRRYTDELKIFFKKNLDRLSDDSKKKININPLRILDSKNIKDKDVIEKAPKINEFLDDESYWFFDEFSKSLKRLGIKFEINPYLVRGLDYYNHTTFEYLTNSQKSQNTVLAGGRYDGLIKSLGGSDLSGIGWAAGVERILMLTQPFKIDKKIISLFTTSEDLNFKMLEIYNELIVEDKFSVNLILGKNFKKKITKADKFNSFGCVIVGDDELKKNQLIWKDFISGNQEVFPIGNLNDFLTKKINEKK